MFTGIVREVGRLRAIQSRSGLMMLEITAPRVAGDLAVGASLAVNGICLTVTAIAGDRVRVDASTETRRVTTVRDWRAGDPVHLEPALRSGESLGGHFVLGHVDGVGTVTRLTRVGGALEVSVAASRDVVSQLLPKGSVAVDGVSLTLDSGPFDRTFRVTLVPHTLRETRFGQLRTGDCVNVEVDVLSKAAMRGSRAETGAGLQARPAGSLTIDAILSRGFSP